MTEKKGLARKMSLIMGEVPTMIKDGQNVPQKYGYTTAEAVKAALRPLFRKHNVGFFAAITDVKRETSINRNSTTVVSVLAKMKFTLTDADTGESMECEWYGEANDYADKSVNKAATAATKYFLTNTFLLSTTEPEADEESIDTPSPELSKAIETVMSLVGEAKKVGVELTVYPMRNMDEATNAYKAAYKELVKSAKSLNTEKLPEPKQNTADAWLGFIKELRGKA